MFRLPIDLGLIEGYYGRPWDWPARARVVALLALHGYRFFLYAPKAASSLRRRWREPMPAAEIAAIAAFAGQCRDLGVRFGVGLSPHEFDDSPRSLDWSHLSCKLALLDDRVGPDELALLFDDIRGDDPLLADRQAAVVSFVAARSRARRLTVCPTYYSDDPLLDRVFGARPSGYLERLGRLLDPAVGVFWTGEEVCSREIGPAHLRDVAQRLGRAPVLWDNYPVNDGQRMSQYLHLRGFNCRPAANAALLAGHAINPALQPVLGCIPALTLAERYRTGDGGYSSNEAFARACRHVLGGADQRDTDLGGADQRDTDLAAAVQRDLVWLHDTGLDRLGDAAPVLRARYSAFDHPAAREIVEWLDGGWRITDEIVRTQ